MGEDYSKDEVIDVINEAYKMFTTKEHKKKSAFLDDLRKGDADKFLTNFTEIYKDAAKVIAWYES